MIELKFTRGRTALLSDEDVDLLSTHSWNCGTKNNIQGVLGKFNAIKPRRLLHHVILERSLGLRPSPQHQADHINGIRLDNRRENLRWCLPTQNAWNTKIRKGTQFKGVCKLSSGRFMVRIMANGTRISLGTFATIEAAARAYDEAAQRAMGEFARLNFPTDNVNARAEI